MVVTEMKMKINGLYFTLVVRAQSMLSYFSVICTFYFRVII